MALFLLVLGSTLLGTASPAAAVAPTVSNVTPSSGGLAGGDTVIIKGSDFTGVTGVSFDAVAATSFAVISDTQIVAEVPASSAAGSKLVTVTNADGSNTSGATYKYEAPSIKSVSPDFADAASSSVVVINGKGFTGAVAADVTFASIPAASVWVVSDTQIVAETPVTTTDDPIANGETDVIVTRNSVASENSEDTKFLFSPGLPTITTLGTVSAPVTGTDGVAIGSDLTITGTRLWAVKTVTFGSAKVTSADDIVIATDGTSMTVKVPTKSSGPVDVIVENAVGQSAIGLGTDFAYYSTAAPKVSSVSRSVFDKDADTGGGTFLVAGSGFTGLTTADVTLKCTTDITPTSVTAVSDTSVIIAVPGNDDDVAEACDLEMMNPIDNTKTVTEADAIRYI